MKQNMRPPLSAGLAGSTFFSTYDSPRRWTMSFYTVLDISVIYFNSQVGDNYYDMEAIVGFLLAEVVRKGQLYPFEARNEV